MSERLTAFGSKCREFRARYGLVMQDQAKGLGISVAYISAIELKKRPIPHDYPTQLAHWLSLPPEDAALLEELAANSQQQVRLQPTTTDQAQLAHDLAKNLGDLSKEGVELLRQCLAISRSTKHSYLDVRKRAMVLSAIFNPDQKLNFDVHRIVENKLHLIDEDFFLKVESEESGQTTLHSHSNGTKVCYISSSPWFYNEAEKQVALTRFKLAHEIAHWLLHREESHAYSRLPTNSISTRLHLRIESEADIFAREFLLPIAVVDRFDDAESLSKAANVPVWVARKRFRELRELTSHDRYTLRLYAKSIRNICIRPTIEVDLNQTLFGNPSKIESVEKIEQKPTPKRSRRRKTDPGLSLFDHADVKERAKSRSTEWFQKYGFRGD